jgi:hypothetical protein
VDLDAPDQRSNVPLRVSDVSRGRGSLEIGHLEVPGEHLVHGGVRARVPAFVNLAREAAQCLVGFLGGCARRAMFRSVGACRTTFDSMTPSLELLPQQ